MCIRDRHANGQRGRHRVEDVVVQPRSPLGRHARKPRGRDEVKHLLPQGLEPVPHLLEDACFRSLRENSVDERGERRVLVGEEGFFRPRVRPARVRGGRLIRGWTRRALLVSTIEGEHDASHRLEGLLHLARVFRVDQSLSRRPVKPRGDRRTLVPARHLSSAPDDLRQCVAFRARFARSTRVNENVVCSPTFPCTEESPSP